MKLCACLLITGSILRGGCATSTPGFLRQASTPPTAAPDPSQVLTPVVTTADDPRVAAANRYAREMGYKLVTRGSSAVVTTTDRFAARGKAMPEARRHSP